MTRSIFTLTYCLLITLASCWLVLIVGFVALTIL